MAVLDSSFLIDVLRNRHGAVRLLAELEQRESLFVPSLAVMGLWEGVLRGRFPATERRRVEELFAAASILDFDARAAKRAAELAVELTHLPLEPEDVMIAAIALVRGEKLVTRDAHYARVPGLVVVKY